VSPVGGTAYPADPYLPVRERFYTRVEAKLNYSASLQGRRRGRPFVTNGPMVEFSAAGNDVGDALRRAQPGSVRIAAKVRLDPERDDVKSLEVLANGNIVRRIERQPQSSELSCQFDYEATESCWLAVRATGKKLAEPNSPYEPKPLYYQERSPALAHSA